MILGPVQWLQTDPDAATPLFEQMRLAIIDAVRDGRLPPGDRLPTVRELAAELGLAVNTVARPYRELESAGIIETRGRQGTFVARTDPTDVAMAATTRASEAMILSGLGPVGGVTSRLRRRLTRHRPRPASRRWR